MYEIIAEQIKVQIIDGKLIPGQKLISAKELAESYQVGRSTIREALSALKAMGLIETKQGEGSYVRSTQASELMMPEFSALLMNKQTVIDILEAREALEVSNAFLAAGKRTTDDLQAFDHVLTLMSEHLGNEEAGEKADFLFHHTLVRATHNSVMVRLFETISSQMEVAIREARRVYMYGDESVSKQLWSEHEAIYAAVKSQNADLAQIEMKKHLSHVRKVLTPFLK